jgi:hypothetical protein
MTIEFEAQNHKGVMQQVNSFQEIFEEKCRKCGCENVRYIIRKAKDNKGKEYDYYELRCPNCQAKLPLGILDDGSDNLFPKRKNEDGEYRGEFGWVQWNREKKVEE